MTNINIAIWKQLARYNLLLRPCNQLGDLGIMNTFGKHNKLWNSILLISLSTILLYICCYRVNEKPGLWFGDEIGYFSSAAYFMGFDWSDQVSSQLAYYGLGYGFFLIPAFFLCNTLKQLVNYSLHLNVFFICCSFLLGIRLLYRIHGRKSFAISCICSFVSALYVNNLVQIQMGWPECLNVLLYWIILNLFYDITQNDTLVKYAMY